MVDEVGARKRWFDDLRRSNAASPHVLKKNKGTRRIKDLKAIKDSSL